MVGRIVSIVEKEEEEEDGNDSELRFLPDDDDDEALLLLSLSLLKFPSFNSASAIEAAVTQRNKSSRRLISVVKLIVGIEIIQLCLYC